MRLENWFISSPDENQRSVISLPGDVNIVVSGPPGSGKTNIALYRANELFGKDFMICVKTHMMKKIIRHGMIQLGLDPDRVMYAWSLNFRGPDVSGDLYCGVEKSSRAIDNEKLFLVKDEKVLVFQGKWIQEEQEDSSAQCLEVLVDHDDYVTSDIYRAFGRRTKRYIQTNEYLEESDLESDGYKLLDSSYIYREQDKYDYIIVDEGQDFPVSWYKELIDKKLNKGLAILGDSAQKLFSTSNGSDLIDLAKELSFPIMHLKHNYRVPKAIAKVAMDLIEEKGASGLVAESLKNDGRSDFPHYDKPQFIRCKTEQHELDYILKSIQLEELEDVLILVSSEIEVRKVHDYFASKGQPVQVRYKQPIENDPFGHFRRIDTMDFRNIDVPAVMSVLDSKGSEFDNVFMPYMESENRIKGKSAYVAFTRSGVRLTLTYSKDGPSFLKSLNSEHIELKTYEE